MTPSGILLVFALSFLGGVILVSFFPLSFVMVLAIAFLLGGFLWVLFLWQNPFFSRLALLLLLGVFLVGFSMGSLRFMEVFSQSEDPTIVALYEQELLFEGNVVREPDVRASSQQLVVRVKASDNNAGFTALVFVPRHTEFSFADTIIARGILQEPVAFDDFSYKDYLRKEGIHVVVPFPEVISHEVRLYDNIQERIFGFLLLQKDHIRSHLQARMPPPQSDILAAMMLGDKRNITPAWQEKLNVSGVRHITAISGLHVTMVSVLLLSFLLALGLARRHAFWVAILFLFLFIAMTGFQPSAVRAGLMGGLFLTAQYLGRTQSSWRALVVAGALMLFDNPLLLRYDVGFQLSFSAMLGVIFLTPFFQNVLSSLRHKTLASSFAKNMQGILAMTLGAVFFTLPVVVYHFDYVSFIAPLANMLIIPVLPWIMLFGFAFAFASFFLIELATIFSWFALVPLTYLVMVVESTSSVPFSASSFPLSHWIIPVFMYFVLLWIAFRLRKTAQESTIGM